MSSKIPTIDIIALYGNDLKSKQNVAAQINAACTGCGFFQISNHFFDWDLETLTIETFRFFKTLNMEQKMSMARKKINPNNNHVYRGYFPAALHSKEGFDIGNPTIRSDSEIANSHVLNEPTQWPDENTIPGFRAYFQEYYEKMTKLSQVLLKGI